MLKFFQDLFQLIADLFNPPSTTNGQHTDSPAKNSQEEVDSQPTEKENEKDTSSEASKEVTGAAQEETKVVKVELQRYSVGTQDVLGKLYIDNEWICYTIEPPGNGHLPPSRYVIGLRKEGGLHGTYQFRLKENHHGMLWIRGANDFPFATIHMGTQAATSWGEIVVGKSPELEEKTDEQRVLTDSYFSYELLYDRLIKKLLAGVRVELSIVQA